MNDKILALEDIHILDLSRVLAGPYATMVLADLGAEVIKVELPEIGDDSRSFGPFLEGESAYFMSLNRNKRSMTLNIKKEAGKKIILELVQKVDVLVENFRPGVMEKIGLDYDVLKLVNPRLIYATVSGFGQSGPYSSRPAYDAIVQAMGGIMSVTGQEGGEPTRIGTSIGDITAGLFTAIGILTALHKRHENGIGQMVDVSMLDCQAAILENAIARYVVSGEIPAPIGNRHPSIVPFESFDTMDGQIMIAAGNDNLWIKFCQAIDLVDLVIDERFKTNPLRNLHYIELRPLIAERIVQKPTAFWQSILDTSGVPNSPINSVADLLENPQIAAREMIVEVQHHKAGKMRMAGVPIKLSHTPGSIRNPAPLLGEHTEEVLRELLGYSQQSIDDLKSQGVI